METLKKNLHFLQSFRSLSPKQQLSLLRDVTPEQSHLIGEIAANVLSGVLKVSEEDKIKFKKFKNLIRLLGSTETSETKRLSGIRKNPKVAAYLISSTLEKLLKVAKASK